MSENATESDEGRQDPAETNELDKSVDTTDQPEPADASGAVEVSPEDPAVTNTVLGKDYSVTPEEGYRQTKEG